jgi:hypothetical protein
VFAYSTPEFNLIVEIAMEIQGLIFRKAIAAPMPAHPQQTGRAAFTPGGLNLWLRELFVCGKARSQN